MDEFLQSQFKKFKIGMKQKLRTRQWWIRTVTITAIIYGLLCIGFFFAMKQPPMRFARVMSNLPSFSMALFPFESLWSIARAGNLKVGDLAPDFRLKKYESSSWVQLSGFREDRPVVLIFGSYT